MKTERGFRMRLGAAILVLILTVMSLAACGTSPTSDTSDQDTAKASAVEWEYVSPEDLAASAAESDGAKADGQAPDSQNGEKSGDSSSDRSNSSDSDMPDSDSSNGQPPEPPDGAQPPSGENGQPPSGENGQPPEKPDGDPSSGDSNSQPPQPPDGATPPSGENGQPPSGGPGGADTAKYDYTGELSAALTADGKTQTSDSETISAADTDQNAVLAQNGGTLEITGAKITKTGSDEDGDNCNFYGLNSSALVTGEDSSLYIKDSSISSDSAGSNGIFATDNGTVFAQNVKITTTNEGNSRGLDATYGGVIYANDTTISTEKDHCAAIATDRGGGYISVTNSSLATAGSGSPLLYSTGDIEVDNVTGTATGSQIAGIEGMNRIVVNNSTLESTNDAISGSDPIKNGVILYQSMSGDADTASTDSCEFEAVDSTLKTNISDGAMFYVTNTTAKVVLRNTNLDFDREKVQLINAAGNDSNNWGTSGKNGGNVTITGIGQTLDGEIFADEISSADVYLTENSVWTGNAAGDGKVSVSIDGSSRWIVTEDCQVSELTVADGGQIVDTDGKTVTVRNGDNVVVEGDSDITVTVSGDYSTSFELPESAQLNTKVLARDAFDEHYDISTKFGMN